MVARAIIAAARECSMPEGVFSFLQGPANELGGALVRHSQIKSVAFTGSRAGGLKLTGIANSRPEPIPVFAEMSSINPVILFPEALRSRTAILGEQFIASMTLGSGQFCTNPGILLGIVSPALDRFLQVASDTLAATRAATMLTPQIHENYQRGVAFLQEHGEVQLIAHGKLGESFAQGVGALFATTAEAFMTDPLLGQEVFGASSLVVACKNAEEINAIIRSLEGQLTITLHVAPEDVPLAIPLVPMLERKAGRLVVNGWPTGVEVSSAMVHGGPYPATSDGRSTSVGTAAIERFLRPVCYQNFPEEMLPSALRNCKSNLHPNQSGEKA
jgi:NADP-dependent aldehyde dehydrogenase